MYIKALTVACLLAIFTVLSIEGCKEQQYVKAMVGEASGEGYDGMYAIACGLRNRGSLDGVYGLNSKHIRSESPKTYKLARKAYRASKNGIDVTFGATHWESIDFETPYWANEMELTVQIGKHRFYKK